ncbi:MAG: hypothetical protein HY300_18075 [Verrucomicrobia bacterium]|nr:hypothetical protein [Verrucomicrobiota bacterium]
MGNDWSLFPTGETERFPEKPDSPKFMAAPQQSDCVWIWPQPHLVLEAKYFALTAFIQKTHFELETWPDKKNACGEKCFSGWEDWHQEHFRIKLA